MADASTQPLTSSSSLSNAPLLSLMPPCRMTLWRSTPSPKWRRLRPSAPRASSSRRLLVVAPACVAPTVRCGAEQVGSHATPTANRASGVPARARIPRAADRSHGWSQHRCHRPCPMPIWRISVSNLKAILFCTTQKVVQVSSFCMAEAYASYMKGALFSEQDKNIDATIINFKNTRAIYEEPGKYGSIENELLCYQCIEEVEPMIDLCSHKLGGSYLQAHELLDTANDLLNEDGCGLEGCVLLGFDIRDVQSPEDIVAAERLVFPGVGAFGSAMDVLNRTGMADALREYIQRDRPFLGICLGLQLLFDSSEENGPVSSLGVIPGVVRRFDSSNGLIVPHIGWNALQITKDTPLLQGADGQHVYFVHSYHVLPAVQFHPEKSGATELSILKEFLRPNSLGTKNEGDEMASKVAFDHPERFSEKFEFSADNIKPLVQTCMTTLSSKIAEEGASVHVHNLVIEQSLVSQSTEFEAAIQNGDKSSLRALCEKNTKNLYLTRREKPGAS
uniref:Glutamine amidotransferase domain-containing protein n=1 Tax=Zea mays TaxID=4577 RepID=A0A804MFF6_MAIZE